MFKPYLRHRLFFYNPVNNLKKKAITGIRNFHAKKATNKNIMKPFVSRNSLNLYVLSGKKPKRIFEPSSGGTGIKLKTANVMFIRTIVIIISTKAKDAL